MSRLRVTKVSQPANPPASTAEVFYDTTQSVLSAIDSSGNVTRLGGFGTKTYRLRRVVTFTTNQSPYTPTADVAALYVECIGGGGGGGSAATTSTQGSCAGGGGGGSYAAAWITTVAASYTITIGAAANGGTAGGIGTAGNDTSFGSAVIGKGGSAGAASTTAGTVLAKSAGGAGGVAGTGDTTLVGEDGEDGINTSGTQSYGGASGSGPWGGRKKTNNLIAAGTIAGVNGGNYGAGGSGGVNTGTQASAAVGGNGAQGICRVWEFA